MTQIDAELAVLDERARRRERQHAELDGTVRGLDALVRAAPRSPSCTRHGGWPPRAAGRAERSAARADQEAQRARQKRTAWAGEMSTHQAACAHHGLPAEAAALDGIAAAARRARDSSGRLGEELTRLADRVRLHGERRQRAAEAEELRDATERDADEAWSRWHAAASELASQHDAVDLSIEQARDELARTKTARDRAYRDREAATRAFSELGPQLGTARESSRRAADDVGTRTAQMGAAAHRFNRWIALPGLAAAATAERLAPIVHPDQVQEVTSAAEAVLAAAAAPRQAASSTVVSKRSASSIVRCRASWTSGTPSRTTFSSSRSPVWATSTPWPARPGPSRPGSRPAGRRSASGSAPCSPGSCSAGWPRSCAAG